MILVEDAVVHTQHDGGVELILGRRTEDHPFGTSIDVLSKAGAVREPPGGFEHDLTAQFLPGECRGILLRGDRDLPAVDDHALLTGRDRPLEPPLHAVILQQQRQVLRVGEVVDRHDLEVERPLGQHSENQPADPSKSIDPHT